METVVLITSADTSLEKVKKISKLVFRQESDCVLHYGTVEHFLTIIYSIAGESEYDNEELAEIKAMIKAPAFFVIDTNSFALLKTFISELPDDFCFLIDSNFGEIISKQEFMKCNSPSDLIAIHT